MKTSDVYQKVTDQIIANLENAGNWNKIWSSPINISLNGHFYSGINHLLLSLDEYEIPVYGTFNQIRRNGGQVKKGQKSSMVVFWKQFNVPNEETGEEETKWFLKIYSVFNVAQATFDDAGKQRIADLRNIVNNKNNERKVSADQIIANFQESPKIMHNDTIPNPCYVPSKDCIYIQNISWFNSSEHYYASLFHELVHSTGHPSRLNRFEADTFDSKKEQYSREELVAELGGSFLTSLAGLDPDLSNSAAYIKGWSSVLNENKNWITWAASRAIKACDFILASVAQAELVTEVSTEDVPF
ncbi:ArdC family protein [Bacteroidota bacterium]